MKTVIEMAREAGLHKMIRHEWKVEKHIETLSSKLEKFAALVREDERERNGRGDYMEGLEEGYAAGQRDEREKSNCYSSVDIANAEQEYKKQQEPVAWMEDSIEFYAKDHPTSTCTIPLYTTPPTVALAVCNWTQDYDDAEHGAWKTGCDSYWYIVDGKPSENGMKFCHGCGKKLVEHPYVEPEDE